MFSLSLKIACFWVFLKRQVSPIHVWEDLTPSLKDIVELCLEISEIQSSEGSRRIID
jgi:hypothetical protein